MTETTTLKTRTYSELMRSFAHQNFNLKVLCMALIGLLFLMMILTLYLVKRGPEVIAIDGNGEIARIETKVTDLQIQTAIREYLSYRHSWTKTNVTESLKKAEFFVAPWLVAAFRKSMIDVQKFVGEKNVTQRLYPRIIEIDLKERKARIVADRITEFDNLKAATEMRLTLSFVIEARSVVNPWGVFIVKETEGGEK